MTYSVKEIFLTLQGEGGQAGRAAVFCRFAGCNLWTGREADRVGRRLPVLRHRFRRDRRAGRRQVRHAPRRWPAAVAAAWSGPPENRLVVLTGGEPLLQLDAPLIDGPARAGASPSRWRPTAPSPAPAGIDWICVSPKADAPLAQTSGQELKLVFPQAGVDPARLRVPGFRAVLPAADGRAGPRGANTARPSPIALPTLAGV